MIQFEKAVPEDAPVLVEVGVRAFHDDVNHGATGAGGPPGYDSMDWQVQVIEHAPYYKILSGERIVGGAFLFPGEDGCCEVARVFIDPDHQNRGIGTALFRWLEETHPDVRCWTLDTPSWNARNHHFYEKIGYRKVGERHASPDGPLLFLYEKAISP